MDATEKVIAAAIQLDTHVGDTQRNLQKCENLALQACESGATWIAVPEFFNTGAIWEPELINAIEDEKGQSANFLRDFSKKHSVVIGGSFLCRVPEGGVRNRYLCFNNGNLVGKHDKDYPTMWENAFYEGGDSGGDTGELGSVSDIRVGAAVCWEFMRTGTAKRLRNKIDILIGGSQWWSYPTNWPAWLTKRTEAYNNKLSLLCVQDTARLIGAPVIHASHCNKFKCKNLGAPGMYHGYMEGNAAIIDGRGNVLAKRTVGEGEGIVLSEVSLGSAPTDEKIPNGFWLHYRTFGSALTWHNQRFLGRRWYKKNVRELSP